MNSVKNNIYTDIPEKIKEELFENLSAGENIRIERIVSKGHSSPEGFWYNQNENEWIILVKGSAALLFEGEKQPVKLKSGDYLNIPAHRKHRVEWTEPGGATIWLAVYYK